MRAIVVATHGVLTRTTKPSWPDYADLAFADCKVEKRDYWAFPFPRINVWIKNRVHASALAAELELLAELGKPFHFIGHSNGTDVNLKTIKILAERGIATETAIFTGSILDHDVERSGIAELIDSKMLGRAYAYCSTSDLPLALPLKYPYRDLGRRGWTLNGKPYEEPRIRTRFFEGFGHGDYFAPEHRDETFRLMRIDMGLSNLPLAVD